MLPTLAAFVLLGGVGLWGLSSRLTQVRLAGRARRDQRLRCVVLSSFAVRLLVAVVLYASSYWHWPLFSSLQTGNGFWMFGLDSRAYDHFGRIVAEHWAKGIEFPRPEIGFEYIAFVAGWYRLLGAHPLFPIMANCWLGALNSLLAYLIGRKLAGPAGYNLSNGAGHRTALLGAMLVGFWPSSLLWSSQLLKDPLSWSLLLTALWLVVHAGSMETLRHRWGFGKWIVCMVSLCAVLILLTRVRFYLGSALSLAAMTVFVPVAIMTWKQRQFWRGLRYGSLALIVVGSTLFARTLDSFTLLSPAHPERGHLQLAKQYEREGKPAEAAGECAKAIALNPNYGDADVWCADTARIHADQGLRDFKQGALTESIAAYERALLFEPSSAPIYANLGIVLGQQQRFERAHTMFATAFSIAQTPQERIRIAFEHTQVRAEQERIRIEQGRLRAEQERIRAEQKRLRIAEGERIRVEQERLLIATAAGLGPSQPTSVEPHGQSPWHRQPRPDGGDIPPTPWLLHHHVAHGRRPWRNGGVVLSPTPEPALMSAEQSVPLVIAQEEEPQVPAVSGGGQQEPSPVSESIPVPLEQALTGQEPQLLELPDPSSEPPRGDAEALSPHVELLAHSASQMNEQALVAASEATPERLDAWRQGFVRSGGHSLMDPLAMISNTRQLLLYTRRALAIGLLAPFPWQWFDVRGSTGVMRTFAGVEMAFWYLLLLCVGVGMWRLLRRSRSRPEIFFFLTAILALALSISLVVANLGTLFRLRLLFLLPLLVVAAVGDPAAVIRRIADRFLARGVGPVKASSHGTDAPANTVASGGRSDLEVFADSDGPSGRS